MDFADWIPTIINVGSSLFGGGGSSAPSAPSSSYLDWGSILQGVGQLASRVEMVPGAGALDEDIRKANRFNLIAGLLGGAGQIAGSQMQASERRGLGQDLSAILSGKGTYTGEAIKKGEYPESLVGKTLEDGIVPPPAPQSKSAALFGLINKYPNQASQILELGSKIQDAEAAAATAAQERQFKMMDLARKAATGGLREVDLYNIAESRGILPEDRASWVAAEKQRRAQEGLASLGMFGFGAPKQPASANLEQMTAPEVTGSQSIPTQPTKQQPQQNIIAQDILSKADKGQQFAPPTAQQEIPIMATTQQQAVDALQQLGLSQDEINSYQKGISNLPTTQTTTQPFAAQAMPTATPTPQAESVMKGLEQGGYQEQPVTARPNFSTPEEQRGFEKRQQRETREIKREDVKTVGDWMDRNEKPFVEVKRQAVTAPRTYEIIVRDLMSDDPSVQQNGLTTLLSSRDDSVVQIGELDRFSETVYTPLERLKRQAQGFLGKRMPLPKNVRDALIKSARDIRDIKVQAGSAAEESIRKAAIANSKGNFDISGISEYETNYKSIKDWIEENNQDNNNSITQTLSPTVQQQIEAFQKQFPNSRFIGVK
jgi:hypothetical protein